MIPLIRYPAGDMGEYTEPEGVPDRKFRMLGRSNTAARAGYVMLYPTDIGNVLKKCGIDYDAYQIVVTHDMRDKFEFRLAISDPEKANTEKFLEELFIERGILKEAIDAGDLSPCDVVWCKATDLEYNQRTGKLKVIIDKRK